MEDYPDAELMLTHSATGALEMIALALDIQPGDEIILPSYTFVSTANAFALRGAKLVFVDIEMATLGIDPDLVEQAITDKTKAIVAMHYGGQACQIFQLKAIAERHQIPLIEDAAMTYGSQLEGQALGTFGDFGVVSFDITKHVSATQGGLLIINTDSHTEKLQQIYHLGTNREAFLDGDVPYYEWVNLGSKHQMPETNASILAAQLNDKKKILTQLLSLSQQYLKTLSPLVDQQLLQSIGPKSDSSYHEIFIVCQSFDERQALASFLASAGIEAFFHYIPLHNSMFGRQYTYLSKEDHTTQISNTLLRLPLHQHMSEEDVIYVSHQIKRFFKHA